MPVGRLWLLRPGWVSMRACASGDVGSQGSERAGQRRIHGRATETRVSSASTFIPSSEVWGLKSACPSTSNNTLVISCPMSMSRVLPSDSNEHSTPLSDNKGRHGTNIPLLSSVSVLDNADNNPESSTRQPSPIVSQGLISCSIVLHPQKCLSCKVPKRPIINHSDHFFKVHKTSVSCLSTAKAGPAPLSWNIGSSRYQSQRLCVRKQLALNSFNTPSSQSRTRSPSP